MPLIIRNRFLPIGRNMDAINLFGVLLVKKDAQLSPYLINHERIHTAQMRELLFVPFYIIYTLEWLFRMIVNRGNPTKSYFEISFERETYNNDRNLNYLSSRRHFAQWR